MQNLAVPPSTFMGSFPWLVFIRLSITGSCFERSMLSLRAAERLFAAELLHEKNITFRSWSPVAIGQSWSSLFEPSRCWEFSSIFIPQWPWGSRWIMNALDTKKTQTIMAIMLQNWIECTTSAILKTLHPRTFVESSICSRPWWYKDGHAPSFWQSP